MFVVGTVKLTRMAAHEEALSPRRRLGLRSRRPTCRTHANATAVAGRHAADAVPR
jgi:hypothetical protein